MSTQSYEDIEARVTAMVGHAYRRVLDGASPQDVAYDLAQEFRDRSRFPPFMVANVAAIAVVGLAQEARAKIEKLEVGSTMDTGPHVAAVGYDHVIGAEHGLQR